MPPALVDMESDDGVSEGGDIEYTKPGSKTDAQGVEAQLEKETEEAAGDEGEDEGEDEAGEDEAGEDEAGEDEYAVEKIISHAFEDDGECKYEVKWAGYEERTWEPEENLTELEEFQNYIKAIGGKPVFNDKSKSKKRKSRGEKDVTEPPAEEKTNGRKKRAKTAEAETSTPTSRAPKKLDEWKPPKGGPGSWDSKITMIDTITREGDDQSLHCYLVWSDGKKTKHPIADCNIMCPQKMLLFYEQHLVFAKESAPAGDSATNGEQKVELAA